MKQRPMKTPRSKPARRRRHSVTLIVNNVPGTIPLTGPSRARLVSLLTPEEWAILRQQEQDKPVASNRGAA